jgi:hypothetical protein
MPLGSLRVAPLAIRASDNCGQTGIDVLLLIIAMYAVPVHRNGVPTHTKDISGVGSQGDRLVVDGDSCTGRIGPNRKLAAVEPPGLNERGARQDEAQSQQQPKEWPLQF